MKNANDKLENFGLEFSEYILNKAMNFKVVSSESPLKMIENNAKMEEWLEIIKVFQEMIDRYLQ